MEWIQGNTRLGSAQWPLSNFGTRCSTSSPSKRSRPALDYPEEDADRISPILQVSADDPPTLLIHGTADTLVPISNSERVYAAFKEARVETEIIIMEGAGHGFRGEQATQATAARVKWFVDHLAN